MYFLKSEITLKKNSTSQSKRWGEQNAIAFFLSNGVAFSTTKSGEYTFTEWRGEVGCNKRCNVGGVRATGAREVYFFYSGDYKKNRKHKDARVYSILKKIYADKKTKNGLVRFVSCPKYKIQGGRDKSRLRTNNIYKTDFVS
eukprot:GEMP01094880.1.p1 GENE.GEMP01094880.1~~GEMP01094880.1.p1  ORF type:complete len:142 (-),score=1.59 GEMP01094880.1:63-488(-)